MVLKRLFPNTDVVEDFMHHGLLFPGTTTPMQLDVWLPQYKLAFEYQGAHHYHDLMMFGTREMYRGASSVLTISISL